RADGNTGPTQRLALHPCERPEAAHLARWRALPRRSLDRTDSGRSASVLRTARHAPLPSLLDVPRPAQGLARGLRSGGGSAAGRESRRVPPPPIPLAPCSLSKNNQP